MDSLNRTAEQDWSFPWMDKEGRAAWPEERPTERSLSLTSARAVKRCKVQAAEDDQEPEASVPGTRSHSISTLTTSTITQGEQGGETSSGNNASNGTTQKLEKAEEAVEASTAPKPPSDDLQELANRGLCAPLWRTAKPSQASVGVPDCDQLQTGWCNYNGLQAVQRGATWIAAHSPSVQASMAQQQSVGGGAMGYNRGSMLSPITSGPQGNSSLAAMQHQQHPQQQHQPQQQMERVFSAQPPAAGMPALPASPFSKSNIPMSPFGGGPGRGEGLAGVLSGESPFTPSTQTKFQWPEDAQSPRQSASDGINQAREARASSITRQVSLPDFGELADLWTEMSNVAPEDYDLDLDQPMPSLPKDMPGPALAHQLSLGMWQSSLARLSKQQDPQQAPAGSLLQDLKLQRRNRSMRFNSALTWQPGTGFEPPVQQRRSVVRLQSLQMGPAIRDHLSMADRSGSSGFHSSGEGPQARANRGPDLPDQVQLSIVAAPSIFAVPTCINKSFKPPFTLRVSVVSSRPTQIKATVAAYTLQREQVAKLEQWHPSQHVFTESLAGSIESESIVCEGATNKQTGDTFPGKHVGTVELAFNDLKFNSSSRMKPRWLVFALALPTDDVIFVQYTVPTIVMSRQCDQTPRALAILRGEVPTRKRARQNDGSADPPRSRTPFPGITPMAPMAAPVGPVGGGLPHFMHSPTLAQPGGFQPQDQESITAGGMYGHNGSDWPQRGPYTMSRWREAIVKVCRALGLTRSFEQEDMHELAKVAGFMGSPHTGSQQATVLSLHQWNTFGKWFIGYLHILKDHKDLWMSPSVQCICSFSVTRERAEQLLIAQPEGTFLVRPSLSMDSTMVISTVMHGSVCHLALDHTQLEARTIEDWVRDIPQVLYVLDIMTGVRYPKHQIFRYRSMLPSNPGLMGLQPNMLSPSMGAPMAPMAPTSLMAPQDALAHIFEASRRGHDGFPHQPAMMGGMHHSMGLGSMPLQDMARGGGSSGDGGMPMSQMIDQWGAGDPFRGPQLNRMDHRPMSSGGTFTGHGNPMHHFGRQ